MLEKIIIYSAGDEQLIEKLIDDDQLMINHMVFPKGGEVPKHPANSNVYLLVVRGNLTISLGEQEPHAYARGSIVNVPCGTFMHIRNLDDEILEFFVLKAPSPRLYRGEDE